MKAGLGLSARDKARSGAGEHRRNGSTSNQDAMLRAYSSEAEPAPASPPQQGYAGLPAGAPSPGYTPPLVPSSPFNSAPAVAGAPAASPGVPSPPGVGLGSSRLRAGSAGGAGFETPAAGWRLRGSDATPSTTEYLTPMGLHEVFCASPHSKATLMLLTKHAQSTQTAPWPDMEIPMTPPPAGAAGARVGAAASLDWRLQLAGRHMSDDLTGSLHGSEGGMSAALDTPVLPKGSTSPLYVDSAAPEGGDAEDPKPHRFPKSPRARAGHRGGGCLSRCTGAALHAAGLVFAEYPLRAHREWMGFVVPAAAAGRGGGGGAGCPAHDAGGGMGGDCKAARRARRTCGLMQRGRADAEARYQGNPKRRRVHFYLNFKRTHKFHSFHERLLGELWIFGELLFDNATPARLHGHAPWFTAAFVLVACIAFAFMAGEYPAYLATHAGAAPGCPAAGYASGPRGLALWVGHWGPCYRFEPGFLVLWGARYGPAMGAARECWRWGASLLLADSFPHLAAAALLFAALALHAETRYGTLRVAALAAAAGLGGNFFDGLASGLCRPAIAGAGVAFGLLPLFAADHALNFETIRYPVLRLLGMAACLAAFGSAGAFTGYAYGLAPLGGALAGALPGALLLPHVKSEKYEWFLPYAAAASVLAFCVLLPAVLYGGSLPRLACPALQQ